MIEIPLRDTILFTTINLPFHHPSWPTDLFTILIYLIITIDVTRCDF